MFEPELGSGHPMRAVDVQSQVSETVPTLVTEKPVLVFVQDTEPAVAVRLADEQTGAPGAPGGRVLASRLAVPASGRPGRRGRREREVTGP